MTSSTSASQPQPRRSDLTLELIAQFHAGPSFRATATQLLRQALNELYPDLNIDPDSTLMGSPTWTLIEGQPVAGPTTYRALSDLLARQAVLQIPVLCIEGEHFLTRQPITAPPEHLPVRMTDIARIINTQAPVMLSAFQAYLVDFWNESNAKGPRWQELSSTLRSGWGTAQVEEWDETDRAMADRLYRFPDRATRQIDDPYASKACIVEIEQVEDGAATRFSPLMLAVLLGEHLGRAIILTYSPRNGYEKFDSLDQLGESLPTHAGSQTHRTSLQWRLSEPQGNFFDQLACVFISAQVEAVGALDFSNLLQSNSAQVNQALNAGPGAIYTPAHQGPNLDWYHHALPDWLKNASVGDQNNFAQHLKDLAALNSLNMGASYLDGIPGIEQYALEQIRQQVLLDHPDALHVPLEKIVFKVQSVVVWGLFVVPGSVETTSFTLVELALQNLIALPLGNKTIELRNGANLPDWLTVDYVEDIIQRVDVGQTYPALIKQNLLELRHESARRKKLYSEQLRIQLPLMALQSKLRRQDGIDEQGYRYLVALMQAEEHDRKVDGQDIVLHQLAFYPTRRADQSYDIVANMYVIGLRNLSGGPCLLYRPLFNPPLIQYASSANLIYDVMQSSTLRSSILPWLPDDVRDDYANLVFPGDVPSPWEVFNYLVDPLRVLILSGPVALANPVVGSDMLGALFNANAQALFSLADRQSVSNAENRWATLKQIGWVLLNAVLPFLNPTLGTAAWIWQIFDQVQALVEASEQQDKPAQWAALTDVLLNIGMAITLHTVTRRQSIGKSLTHEPGTPVKPPLIKRLPLQTASARPTERAGPLSTSGALNRLPGPLATVLDSFHVVKPKNLGQPITEAGTYQHLYRSGRKYYVSLGQRWFEVSAQADEPVVIIDPNQPERSGPALIHNAAGQWFIDTRLRLRGGGPKHASRRASLLATEKAKQLRDKLQTFETGKKAASLELEQARTAMTEAPGTSAAARREGYLQALDSQRSDYETALQDLKKLNVFEPLADYPPKALSYLRAQLELTEFGIRETQQTFTPGLRTIMDQVTHQAESPGERHIEDAQHFSQINQDMIERLDYVESRFEELRELGQQGYREISQHKGLLPSYTSSNLKALQLTTSRNLCLSESSLNSTPQAWSTLDDIVNTADVAAQTLHDTLFERSEARLDERIEALGSLTEQFAVVDERLEDLSQEFSAEIIPEQLQRLRAQIHRYSQDTQLHLARLHLERDNLRHRPTPPPTPPAQRKMFIRTRYDGLLIGEPRSTQLGHEPDFVDIKSPITQHIIATYHKKDQAQWVRRITAPAAPAPVAPDLTASLDQAQAFLDGLSAFKARAHEQAAKPARTAVGIEYLYHQHALRLEETQHAIDHALSSPGVVKNELRSATLASQKLKEATADLYLEANQQVRRMIIERPPTVEGVEWLLQRKEVTLKKTISRRRIKGVQEDYLDEYTIVDRSRHNVLWYAHFHYSASWTPPRTFISARLKTPAEHRMGAAADTVNGFNQQQRLDYYRSEINLEQARRLFFNL